MINDKKNPQAIGFICPNSAGHKPLKKYIVTVDSVEKRTDIDFFPALPDEIENIQRCDLNCIEEAVAMQRLMDHYGYTQEVLARKLDVTNKRRVLK